MCLSFLTGGSGDSEESIDWYLVNGGIYDWLDNCNNLLNYRNLVVLVKISIMMQ